jgi:hypothetical protein
MLSVVYLSCEEKYAEMSLKYENHKAIKPKKSEF